MGELSSRQSQAEIFSAEHGHSSTRARLESAVSESYGKWEAKPDDNLGRVVSVYDGDTLTILCSLGGSLFKINVRIKGVDCPEMRGRGEKEKVAAVAVRDAVRSLCLDKVCGVTSEGTDKYGRMIGDVWLPSGGYLSDFLLNRGLARPYAGATRKPFSEVEIASIIESGQAVV